MAEDFGLAPKDNLSRCLDQLLAQRAALFQHLRSRWEDGFGGKFAVLLDDLTRTHFERAPPFPQEDKRSTPRRSGLRCAQTSGARCGVGRGANSCAAI